MNFRSDFFIKNQAVKIPYIFRIFTCKNARFLRTFFKRTFPCENCAEKRCDFTVAKTCKNPYPARIFARYKSIKKRAEAQGEKPFVFARKNKPKNSIIYNAFFGVKSAQKSLVFYIKKASEKRAKKSAFFTQENRSGSHIVFCAKKRAEKRAEKSRKKDVKNQAKIPHCFSQKYAAKKSAFLSRENV